MAYEINAFGNCFGTDDFTEGTQAFIEKEKLIFKQQGLQSQKKTSEHYKRISWSNSNLWTKQYRGAVAQLFTGASLHKYFCPGGIWGVLCANDGCCFCYGGFDLWL